jgi:hypothetical protein
LVRLTAGTEAVVWIFTLLTSSSLADTSARERA